MKGASPTVRAESFRYKLYSRPRSTKNFGHGSLDRVQTFEWAQRSSQ
jgi:hypothetical protein